MAEVTQDGTKLGELKGTLEIGFYEKGLGIKGSHLSHSDLLRAALAILAQIGTDGLYNITEMLAGYETLHKVIGEMIEKTKKD